MVQAARVVTLHKVATSTSSSTSRPPLHRLPPCPACSRVVYASVRHTSSSRGPPRPRRHSSAAAAASARRDAIGSAPPVAAETANNDDSRRRRRRVSARASRRASERSDRRASVRVICVRSNSAHADRPHTKQSICRSRLRTPAPRRLISCGPDRLIWRPDLAVFLLRIKFVRTTSTYAKHGRCIALPCADG
jgi:hypothetical protein